MTNKPQSEAPSVDKQLNEILERLCIKSIAAFNDRHIDDAKRQAKAKINRLIIEAELRGFDKAFDSHDYDGLREYRAALSNNLSKGGGDE